MYPVKRRYRKQVGDVFLVPYDLDAEFEDNENGKYLPKPTDQVMLAQYFYREPRLISQVALFEGSYTYSDFNDEVAFWGLQNPVAALIGVYDNPMIRGHFPFVQNAEVAENLLAQQYLRLYDKVITIDGTFIREYDGRGTYPTWSLSSSSYWLIDIARFLHGLPTKYPVDIHEFKPHDPNEINPYI